MGGARRAGPPGLRASVRGRASDRQSRLPVRAGFEPVGWRRGHAARHRAVRRHGAGHHHPARRGQTQAQAEEGDGHLPSHRLRRHHQRHRRQSGHAHRDHSGRHGARRRDRHGLRAQQSGRRFLRRHRAGTGHRLCPWARQPVDRREGRHGAPGRRGRARRAGGEERVFLRGRRRSEPEHRRRGRPARHHRTGPDRNRHLRGSPLLRCGGQASRDHPLHPHGAGRRLRRQSRGRAAETRSCRARRHPDRGRGHRRRPRLYQAREPAPQGRRLGHASGRHRNHPPILRGSDGPCPGRGYAPPARHRLAAQHRRGRGRTLRHRRRHRGRHGATRDHRASARHDARRRQ